MPEDTEELEQSGGGGRPLWSGTLSFGLVSVPVQLVAGNRAKQVSLHMVTEEGTQLKRRYFTESGRKPLTNDDIVRGYEVEKGKFVVVEDEDLERLAPERTRDIDLSVFVPVEDIDPIYFERAYFMIPTGGGAKAYRLLAQVMEETGRAGIATFVMRAKEYLVAIMAENGVMRAETLRFADELRSPEDVGLPKVAKASAADEKRMIAQMKKLYKAKLNPKELEDTSGDELIALAQKKAKAGDEVVTVSREERDEQAPSGDVIDLMSRLRESLKTGSGAPSGRASAKKRPARRKRTRAGAA